MKRVILAVLCSVLTACDHDVSSREVEYAITTCNLNGGLVGLSLNPFVRVAQCKNSVIVHLWNAENVK